VEAAAGDKPTAFVATFGSSLNVIRINDEASKAQQAVIAPAKIRDYLLSTSHAVGRFKAPFFAGLGYTDADWQTLEQDLLAIAASGDAELGRESPYRQKYEIRGTLTGPSGKSANVLTVWIVRFESDVPQFVTAFPGETK
jgi:hypothetical protein